MRVIIIEDKDCTAVLDQLKLERMMEAGHFRNYKEDQSEAATINDVHRAFHFVVVRWLQSQGWKS